MYSVSERKIKRDRQHAKTGKAKLGIFERLSKFLPALGSIDFHPTKGFGHFSRSGGRSNRTAGSMKMAFGRLTA